MNEKDKRRQRILQKKRHIDRQMSVFKQHKMETYRDVSPHIFHKKSVVSCGNPNCMGCRNPRKIFDELTMQERRYFCDSKNTE